MCIRDRSMTVRVAINGFGRIGRPFFRLAFEDPCIDIVAINDLMDNKTFAHLLQYDSTFGKYKREVAYDADNLIAVSYTHLDVYKRQRLWHDSRRAAFISSASCN